MTLRSSWVRVLLVALAAAALVLWAYVSGVPFLPTEKSIALERTACFGACPMYKVTLYGSGRVVFEGDDYTTMKHAESTVDPREVERLIDRLLAAHFLDADAEYREAITDTSNTIISLHSGMHDKTVSTNMGSNSGDPMADELYAIGKEIDRVADVKRWFSDAAGKQQEERQRIQKELDDKRDAGLVWIGGHWVYAPNGWDAGPAPKPLLTGCHMLDGTRVSSCAPGDSLCTCD